MNLTKFEEITKNYSGIRGGNKDFSGIWTTPARLLVDDGKGGFCILTSEVKFVKYYSNEDVLEYGIDGGNSTRIYNPTEAQVKELLNDTFGG